uniref:Uncharacterized protein n=1 Tax=Meloidogyne incognita TaxID=6306 RepID=A0A914KX41_MELIC
MIRAQIETSIGQSNHIIFVLDKKSKSWFKTSNPKTIVVSVESTTEIEGQIRSQTWTLYQNHKKAGPGNFYDFNKVHQFNFGQYKPVENSLYLDIQSNYGAFEESMLVLAKKANNNAEITKKIERQIKNVQSVAKIPEKYKKYFASISGFNEEIELSREQFYDAEIIRLDLMKMSAKSTLTKVLSSSAKKLSRLSSSKSFKSNKDGTTSAIEKHIREHKDSMLEISISMKAKCGICSSGDNGVFDNIVYLTNGRYRCQKCQKEFENERNPNQPFNDVKIELPSLSRTIANPILQNGAGLGFTYIFDFGEKKDKNGNINYVQLVELTPNNLHNESASSSNVPEYGYETPEHPTYVSSNFAGLNLNDEDGNESETERPNYAAKHGGQGTKLHFDGEASSSGSSGQKKPCKPPKGNHKINRGMAHPNSVKPQNGAQTQPKLKKVTSMPVQREQEHGSNNHGISYGNPGFHAPHTNHGINQDFVGGWDHNGQFAQMGSVMPHPGLKGETLHPGYGFYKNGEHSRNGAFGEMYNHGDADKPLHRSASMPVDNGNGGYYNGGQSSSPGPSYWTDTSSDYSSSQPSLFGLGNDSMNMRENVMNETQSGYPYDSFNGSHSGYYGGNHYHNNDEVQTWTANNGGESWNDHFQNHQMNQQWNETPCQDDEPGCHIM